MDVEATFCPFRPCHSLAYDLDICGDLSHVWALEQHGSKLYMMRQRAKGKALQ